MNEVISKTIKFKSNVLPPEIETIEKKILEEKIEPLRWAIVDVQKDIIVLSVSGRKL